MRSCAVDLKIGILHKDRDISKKIFEEDFGFPFPFLPFCYFFVVDFAS